MEKLKMRTINQADANFEKLASLFPNIVTESIDSNGNVVRAIDAQRLAQEINSVVLEGNDERYQFTWPDKRKAQLAANAPISATLRPCREESVDFDTTGNLYIEGDNLDVLKCLKETYSGKIKMIYIDPPYNTGNDFVYNDDFAESASEYLANSGQYDDQGNRLVTNTESNGRYHTDWLNMMYPRLKVARDLLTEDGVIFISIDDNEVENLRKICDEIFGESNFVGIITIKGNPRGRQSSSYLAQVHDFLIVYRKSYALELQGFAISDEDIKKRFNKSDESGVFEEWELRKRGAGSRREDVPTLYFPIYYSTISKEISTKHFVGADIEITPKLSDGNDGRWRWSKEKIENEKSKLYVRQNSKGIYNIYERKELSEKSTQLAPTIWDYSEVNTELGTKLVRTLFEGAKYFDFPKPIGLLSRILQLLKDKDSLILDFFSGSATTAHSVMKLNAEDGGDRKFIMVQLPEQTDAKSEAYKAGYKNICEIGKERIRRAGKKIKAENPNATALDTGFRVLKLADSNMLDVYYSPAEVVQQDLFAQADNIKSDRTPEDLLFQVMLELGVLLDSKIEVQQVAGKQIYNVADGFLIACFDKGVTDEVITAIAKQHPQYAVLRDSSYADDSTATNFEQLFKTYSPSTTIKTL